MGQRLIAIWTVYDHPSDYPDHFVARLWEVRDKADGGGSEVLRTESVIQSAELDTIRATMLEMGLYRMDRFPDDDPNIVETWL